MDGWITIGTKIDEGKFDKQLVNLVKKIKDEENKSELKLKAKLQADAEYNYAQAEGYAALAKIYAQSAKDNDRITEHGYENRVNALNGELIANKEFAEKAFDIRKRLKDAISTLII